MIEKSRTPDNLSTFVRKFDVGGYPELIAPPPRCLAKPGDASKKKRAQPPGQHVRTPRNIKNHTAKLVGRFHEAGA